MSNTYSNVDGSRDVAAALDWQDRIDAWPAIQAYKQRTYELLGDDRPVLDVGCGTGLDALALSAVGIDASRAMCERARSRAATVARADATQLPFPDGSFDGARADRVFQHLADPDAGLAELIRVTRPGGRIVIADPDQDTLLITIPGAPDALVAELRRLRRDVGYRNGTLAQQLPSRFADAGLRDITIDPFPLVLTNPDDAFGLPTWPAYWGLEARGWEALMERARSQPGFAYKVLYFVVSGVRESGNSNSIS
jgi:ubiquinone/menaquinone biosynthesis C-methylase UbiE